VPGVLDVKISGLYPHLANNKKGKGDGDQRRGMLLIFSILQEIGMKKR